MLLKLRFAKAADNRRPYGAHRFEVWSPKLRRRLKLFGKQAFHAWLGIEADPDILAFCERPLARKGDRHNRVIDFWVQRRAAEELWVLLRPSELQQQDTGAPLFPGFDEWARRLGIVTKYIRSEEELLSERAAANWRFMLHHLAANRDLVSKTLLQRLQAAASLGRSIEDLEREFAEDDPVLVRSGIFSLIHRGSLTVADLVRAPIRPDTRVAGP